MLKGQSDLQYPSNRFCRFVMMTATGSELLAVTDTGILYGWSWDQEIGDLVPHKVAQNLIPGLFLSLYSYHPPSANDPIVQISSSRLRVVCLLKSGQICSWLDNYLLGDRVCSATEVCPFPLYYIQFRLNRCLSASTPRNQWSS